MADTFGLPSLFYSRSEQVMCNTRNMDNLPRRFILSLHFVCNSSVLSIRRQAYISRQNKERSIKEAEALYSHLPDQTQWAIHLAKEKGASTWPTVLPFTEHGFSLHRSAFHDALALWYPNSHQNVTVTATSQWNMHFHMLRKGSPQSDIMKSVTWLTLVMEVCNDMYIEPNLQPVSFDQLSGVSANSHMVWELSCQPMECGVRGMTTHTLMRGFTIPMPHQTKTWPLLLAIECMNVRRNGPTSNKCMRWSIPCLHPSFSRQQKAWALKQHVFTSTWPHCSPKSRNLNIVALYADYDAA